MESGRSALKITTASYFRPSGVNIHRFPDSKKEDDWGVKPDEGHLVELDKERWQEWVKAREMVDIHHGHPADPATPPYVDTQLEHATNYLLSQLKTVTETSASATP